jgi:molecular chaperone GrpE
MERTDKPEAGKPASEPAAPAPAETPGGEVSAADSDIEALTAELANARQAAEENWNRLLRMQAELDNLRKRTAREVENAYKYSLDGFMRDLLPVIDSLELGINAADTSGDAAGLRQGMELTLKMILDTVARYGVEPIAPLGEKFNPELHEAVSVQEGSGTDAGTVITVVQRGYRLNNRLIRPAKVVVAK